jgi:chromosome segregation ATPase
LGGAKDPKGEVSKEETKRLEKITALRKKEADVLDAWREAQADAEKDAADAALARDEKIADAKERFAERKAEIEERYREQIADAEERFAETKAEAEKRQRDADEAARKKHAQAILDINAAFNRKEIELKTLYNDKVKNLEMAAEAKRQEIAKQGAEKLADIIGKEPRAPTQCMAKRYRI